MTRCMLVTGLAAVLALCSNVWAGGEKKQDAKQKTGVDLDALFKKLDADGDGKISADEFKKLEEHYKPQGRPTRGQFDPDQLKKLMDRFGKGGAGKIDPDQLKKLLDRFGKKGGAGAFDPEMLKKLIEDLGKGGAGGFDLEQLQKLLERFKQGNSEPVQLAPRAIEVRVQQLRRSEP